MKINITKKEFDTISNALNDLTTHRAWWCRKKIHKYLDENKSMGVIIRLSITV
jgi:anti-anti-sigma regulatory factor